MKKKSTSLRSETGLRPHRKLVLSGCTALALLAPALANSQEADTANSTLEPIVIEGSGKGVDTENDSKSIVAEKTTAGSKMATDILDTPATVSVITSKEIQDRGASTVEEVLQYTPGVTTDFYGSDDRFDYLKVRGFDAYSYRDGLPIGRASGGLREESYAFERVEVLKGANSTIFGVSDPGGSINYTTKLPKTVRFGEVYVTGGSYEHGETGFDFGDNITEDDTLSYRLTGKLQRADAEYDYSQNDENFIMGGLTWRPSAETNLSVVFDHLDRDGVPGGGGHPIGIDFARSRFFGEPDFNYRGVNRNSINVLFDHDFGNGLTFGANARYSNTATDFGYLYVSGIQAGTTVANRQTFANNSSSENFVFDAHLQYDATFENVDSRTLVGVFYNDVLSYNDTYFDNSLGLGGSTPPIDWTNPIYSGRPTLIPLSTSSKNDQVSKAIYLQQEFTFFDKLIATVGLRNDWIETTQTNRISGATPSVDSSTFTSRLGLTYKFTDELAAYVSYAESVVPSAIPTTGVSLEPELGHQYEVGVKYRPNAFPALFSAAIYDLTKENVSLNIGSPALPVYTTAGKLRARGIDLEAKAELTNNISLTAAYSYVDTEIVENNNRNEGKRFTMVPDHMASTWVNYTWEGDGPRGDMSFGLGARYMGSYYSDAPNTIKTDSSVVFDASYTYKIRENTTFQLNVSNLFDEKNVSNACCGGAYYNPGRAVYATLRQTW